MPIGALLSKRLATGFRPGDHGTTFGGSPPIAAAALATIEVVERDDLIGNAARVGEHLSVALAGIDGVAAVRGAGLLLAVELVDGDAAGAATALRERGVIVNAVSDTAIRLCPPLVITMEQAELAIEAFRAVLAARG
jgi:acetylornithine/succinyldiaminopimelate/putrescine aminotransferase